MMDAKNSSSPTILVVEDIEWIRLGMKRRLESYGYRVAEATNEEDAVSTAERVCPDLILTEEEFPTFFELTRRIREHSTLGHVPIVIVNPDEEEGARYGDAILLEDFTHLHRALAPSGGR
jgi:CheY-like chemotaxis protein